MRKSLLLGVAVATSLALAGPAFAQSEQPPAQSQPSTSSTTSTTTSTMATTVTGTVVSSSDNELVIDTATGRQRFVVESGTSDIPSNLAPGTQVTVEFKALTGDRRQVARVTASPPTSTSPSSSTQSAPATTRSADPTISAPAAPDRDRDHPAGVTDADRDDNALPATASPLGLVGLLGLLSLGASFALRAWRRRF